MDEEAKPLMVRLTPTERAELERRRIAGGHRSFNETIKAMLRPANPLAQPPQYPVRMTVGKSDGSRPASSRVMTDAELKSRASEAPKPRGFDTNGDPIY